MKYQTYYRNTTRARAKIENENPRLRRNITGSWYKGPRVCKEPLVSRKWQWTWEDATRSILEVVDGKGGLAAGPWMRKED
jgi:hypothetical protein